MEEGPKTPDQHVHSAAPTSAWIARAPSRALLAVTPSSASGHGRPNSRRTRSPFPWKRSPAKFPR
eukprot:11246437-Alexandrium_andersonii.AAC.1